jgi:hypothetical protein
MCGEPATELDHDPPISRHVHVEGSGCCRSLPACGPCQRKQGAELSGQAVTVEVDDPPDSPGPTDPVWAVDWLTEFLDVPEGATWPRYMTVPHPNATGSYGAEAIEWLETETDIDLRWFQRLALVRQLEHDADGTLVWLTVLETTARQVGKSILLRAAATWRLHQTDRFGEPQTLMHTGKDLPVCKEVQRLARAWAKERGYPTRETNGLEEIGEPRTGSRWIVRGKGSVYGYSVSYGMVDESWGVLPRVVEDGLEPTLAERSNPQLVLASTAHSRATPLFPTHRANALSELGSPSSTFLIEWSARRDAPIDDPAAWRAASPHWSEGRERLIAQRVARVVAGELLDPDESDPVESFRSQFLNVWPMHVSKDLGSPLIDLADWAACDERVETTGPLFVAIEDNYGHGAAIAVAARTVDDRIELDGWSVGEWSEAFADLELLAATADRVYLTVAPSMIAAVDARFRPSISSTSDTRAGLVLLRQFSIAGLVCHYRAPELDVLTTTRVVEGPVGLKIVPGKRTDLVRAASWALLAAYQSRPAPSIR